VTPTPRRDAGASGLRYVSPDGPGIRRRRAGRGFVYLRADGRRVASRPELDRIRAIAIPPAWTEVWICPSPEGHIQAIGRDARGRRQYRYHRRFRTRRDAAKFARLAAFGGRLPRIRRAVRHDLARRGLPRRKVLAAVVSLLDSTFLRIGNEAYARLNRSFGLSTLRDRHATVTGSTVRFRFRGKGGQVEERALVDRRLATIVRRCQELPGQELFQYLDAHGDPQPVASDDVNAYLREVAGSDEVSAKDFRTWAATVLAFRALRQGAGEAEAAGAHGGARPSRRNPVLEALRRTAEELGDTLAVTRASYVHPEIVDAFEGEARPSEQVRRRRRDGPPTREEEREVLRLLRSRRRAARRSQVGGRAVAGGSRRRSA
jgi:DNA topoisomerase I